MGAGPDSPGHYSLNLLIENTTQRTLDTRSYEIVVICGERIHFHLDNDVVHELPDGRKTARLYGSPTIFPGATHMFEVGLYFENAPLNNGQVEPFTIKLLSERIPQTYECAFVE